MHNIIILGATSNICSIRVFDNLNNIYNKINTIYCYGSRNWSTTEFFEIHFNKKVKLKSDNKILNKINYINGNYDIESYNKVLLDKIYDNTIIYVATPYSCYSDILNFLYNNKKKYILVLEKPLSINYDNFIKIYHLFTNKVIMIDHFLFKKDIINIINKYRSKKISRIKLQFNYTDDVEDRLGYFDQVGFFIDMFQSHFLSIIYSIIGDKIKYMINLKINKNIRKQYKGYGGKNNVDTYFYVEFSFDNIIYIFEAGKAMNKDEKYIFINSNKYKINNYENEYELFFKDILNDNINTRLIKYNKYFWLITDKINNHFKVNHKLKYYDKYSF